MTASDEENRVGAGGMLVTGASGPCQLACS